MHYRATSIDAKVNLSSKSKAWFRCALQSVNHNENENKIKSQDFNENEQKIMKGLRKAVTAHHIQTGDKQKEKKQIKIDDLVEFTCK